jgi:hypothetical protein
MGMKTTVLNATAHRMRSVRTAKTSPNAVTTAGAIRIQMKLLTNDLKRMLFVDSGEKIAL